MLHASLVAARVAGCWRGALLRGPSGCGKSDLALRLVETGWRLVADDRVIVWSSGGGLHGRAPAALAGLVELRGQGMAHVPWLPSCAVALAADLGEPEERQPALSLVTIAGLRLPRHTLRPFDASTPARLRLLLCAAL